MANKAKTTHILVVGNQTSLTRAGLEQDKTVKIDLVGSLAEAAAKQTSTEYDKVIIDPAALDSTALQILASPKAASTPGRPDDSTNVVDIGGSASTERLLPGSGEMGDLIRAFDWSSTPLGSIEVWPQSLRTMVPVILASQFPMDVLWGPDLLQIYNDPYRQIAGAKHPQALGKSTREIWSEVWHINKPIFEAVLSEGRTTLLEDQLFPIDRRGFLEETFFTLCYSPIPDDTGGVGGVLVTLLETTKRVLSERRMRLLHELDAKAPEGYTAGEVAGIAAAVLSKQVQDIPFALLYLLDPDGQKAHLVSNTGLVAGEECCPATVDISVVSDPWPLAEVIKTGNDRLVQGLSLHLETSKETPFTAPPCSALVVPLVHPAQEKTTGVMVLGVSPALQLDQDYRRFLSLVAGAASTHIANARAYERERRQTEEALREIEKRQRALIDASSEALYRMSADWTEMRTLKGGGFIEDTTEARSDWLAVYIPSDEQERVLEAIHEAIRKDSVFELEHQVLRRDGTLGWTYSRAVPVRDASGDIVEWFGAASDVTERKATEQALRKYKLLSENSRDIILFIRRDGSIFEANEAAVTNYGYSREELLSLRIFDLRASESVQTIEQQMAQADHYGVLFETVHRRKDGTEFPVEASSRGIDMEGQRVLLSIIRDITARKQAEEALRESQQTKSNLLEKLNEAQQVGMIGSWDWDLKTNDVWWSNETYRIFGVTPQDFTPSFENNAQFIHPDDMARYYEAFQHSLQTGQPLELDVRVVIKNGPAKQCSAKGRVVYDDAHQPVRFVGTITDITSRKQAEDALRESEERLKRSQEIAHLGSWEYDLTRNKLTWSDEVYRIFDLKPGDFEPTYETFLQHVHPDDRNAVHEAYSDSLRKRTDSYEIEHRIVRDGTGEVRSVHEKCEHVSDHSGQVIRSVGMIHDITERKKIEEELQKAREEAEHRAEEAEEGNRILEALMEYIPEGITIADAPDVSIRMVSKYGQRLIERAREDIEGIPVDEHVETWDIYCADGETRPTGDELPLSRAVRKGEVVTNEEWVVKTGGGRKITISTNTGPIRDDQGNITGAVIAWRDITENKEIEKQREELLEREHHIAEVLQDTVLVEPKADMPCCEVAIRYEPALEEAHVGGDFYDVFGLDTSRYGVLIGDVAGKGLAAARRVAEARHAVRNYSYLDPHPGKTLSLTNDTLCRDGIESAPMVTAFFAVVDAGSNTVAYANAGHENVLLVRASGDIEELKLPGMVLGLMCGHEYQESSRQLGMGDTLVMVTDGITEARTAPTQLFGIARVKQCLHDAYQASPGEIAEKILQGAREFGGGILSDDAAIVVFRFGRKNDR